MNSCFTLSFFIVFVQISSTQGAPTYLYHDCPNTTLFASNSTYQSNLNTLLSTLSSDAINSTDVFANATAGQNPPDQAYGLFLCRGDVNVSTCSDCVATAKQDILQKCPDQRVSVIWYDECMLRYSNKSIFSVVEEEPAVTFYNTGNVTDPAKFVQVLGETIKEVAWRASGKRFAIGEAPFTQLQNLYTMAQCTPDLNAWDCNTCLRSVIPRLVPGKQGGRIFTPSCNVRFELYLFYNLSPEPAPLPPPPPPPPPVEGNIEHFFCLSSAAFKRRFIRLGILVPKG